MQMLVDNPGIIVTSFHYSVKAFTNHFLSHYIARIIVL